VNIKSALHTDRMCKALTGLTVAEFESLVVDFSWNYQEYEAKRKPDRQRKLGGGAHGTLETMEEKFFYSLFYLKTYPTFDVASFYVGFARSKACEWAHRLFPILEQTLKRKLILPQRKISDPVEFMRLFPEIKEVFGDGVERVRQRPKKKRTAQKTYSGKKKLHTRKSVVIVDKNRKVLILTKQKSGRRHDKRLADKEHLFTSLPEGIDLYVDTGFQGVTKFHHRTYIPKKRRKGKPLTVDDKEMNRLISSYRVVVEHAIGGIKRYRCVSEKLRNRKAWIDDTFMLLSAGLWNYHLSF
jgi:hypothetical protein